MPSFSLVGALEFRQVVSSLQHEAAGTSLNIFDSPYTPYAGGHYNSIRSRSRTLSRDINRDLDREVDPWDAALGVPLDERSHPRVVLTPALTEEPDGLEGSSREGRSHSRGGSVPSISRTPASPTVSDGDTESQNFQPPTRHQRFMHVVQRVNHRLFPSLHSFRSKTVLGQIASVFAAPAVMLLTLTLPVVVTPYQSTHHSREKTPGEEGNLIDFEEEGIERILIAEEEVEEELHGMTYSKWLTAAQCTFGPLFCAMVLFGMLAFFIFTSVFLSFAGANKHYQLWALISAGIVGFAASVLVALFGANGEHPSFRMARCSIGFIVAIVWIMAIADEVVKVLQVKFQSLHLAQSSPNCLDLWIHLRAVRCHYWFNHFRSGQLPS